MIEQYMSNCRFICTANYIVKIPEPIQSRFSVIEFKKPSDERIFPRMRFICDSEKIIVEDNILKKIIEASNGDVRSCINTIQQLSSNDTKTISSVDLLNTGIEVDELTRWIFTKDWLKIRYELPPRHPDYNKLLVDLEFSILKSDLETDKKAKITEIISSGIVELGQSLNEDIAFSAVCSRIINVL
jgi:replication factor C small subunit